MTNRLNVSTIEYSIVIPLTEPRHGDVIVKWELVGEDKQKVEVTTTKNQLLELLQNLSTIQREIDLLYS